MALNLSKDHTFTSGTTILSAQVNADFDELYNAFTALEGLTGSLSNLLVDTILRSSGTIQSADGLVGTPGLTFSNDTDTGFYRVTTNELGVTAGGAQIGRFTSAGLIMNSLRVTGLLAPTANGQALRYENLVNTTGYTPTFSAGWGTAASVSVFYRIFGDEMKIWGQFTTGTVTAAIGTISLPSGFAIDTAKIGNNERGFLGALFRQAGASTSVWADNRGSCLMVAGGSANPTVMTWSHTMDTSSFKADLVNSQFTNTNTVSFCAIFPCIAV